MAGWRSNRFANESLTVANFGQLLAPRGGREGGGRCYDWRHGHEGGRDAVALLSVTARLLHMKVPTLPSLGVTVGGYWIRTAGPSGWTLTFRPWP